MEPSLSATENFQEIKNVFFGYVSLFVCCWFHEHSHRKDNDPRSRTFQTGRNSGNKNTSKRMKKYKQQWFDFLNPKIKECDAKIVTTSFTQQKNKKNLSLNSQ